MLVLALIIVLAIDRIVQGVLDDGDELVAKLKVRPDSERIYLLGNSMFKTGIDLEILQNQLPSGTGADLAYYDGHYTNAWYLMVRNGILPASEHPRVLVWGFRPTYALAPRLRQRRAGAIEQFSVEGDRVFMSINGEPRLGPRQWAVVWLRETLYLFSRRNDLRAKMSRGLALQAVELLEALGYPLTEPLKRIRSDANQDVADYFVQVLSGGKVQMMEEEIADGGSGKLAYWERVPFAESFVPRIADMLLEAGVSQLVVLFKPARYLDKGPDPASMAFYRAAIDYFDRRGIPYVDLVSETGLSRQSYAAGDHYNAAGRKLVSTRIGQKLREMLESARGK